MTLPRALAAATLALGSLVVVAGCGGSSSGAGAAAPPATVTQAPPTTVPPTIVAPTRTVTATATASPSSSGSASGSGACLTSDLTVHLGPGNAGASNYYQPIVFENSSSAPCTLYGYPGVSFVANSGQQVGRSAARSSGRTATIRLQPGSTGSALLHLVAAAAYSRSSCRPAKATALRVYPPGETAAAAVRYSTTVCTTSAGRAQIGPMVHGSTAGQ